MLLDQYDYVSVLILIGGTVEVFKLEALKNNSK